MLAHESAILTMLLAGDREALGVLRDQLAHSEVAGRKYTGHGFFTRFRVPRHLPRVRGDADFVIDDVHAEVCHLQHGAGFILFVRGGVISCLEGFAYGDDSWPEIPELLRLFYTRLDPNSHRLVECDHRDLAWTGRFEA